MSQIDDNISVCPLRLHDVKGFDSRTNDVIYCPGSSLDSKKVVVFFPGDVQDYTENMNNHRDNKNYVQWNLETTACLLRSSFGGISNILIIRPSRMEYKTFSCYHNFVTSNKCGVPEHSDMYNALNHLEALISNIGKKVQSLTETELKDLQQVSQKALSFDSDNSASIPRNLVLPEPSELKDTAKHLQNSEVTLIGFSKGCVVLNQFLYELNYYCETSAFNVAPIVSKIKHMYWLDGGHNGGKNTWINSAKQLETLVKLGIFVHIHVTPYQIKDDRRPWIKKEEKCFYETLLKLGANVERRVHFEDLVPSLLVHFDVLKSFNTIKLNSY